MRFFSHETVEDTPLPKGNSPLKPSKPKPASPASLHVPKDYRALIAKLNAEVKVNLTPPPPPVKHEINLICASAQCPKCKSKNLAWDMSVFSTIWRTTGQQEAGSTMKLLITDNRTEGKPCPECGCKVMKVVCDDVRGEDEKKRHPLTEEDKTILFCACNHPGDCMIGGFF